MVEARWNGAVIASSEATVVVEGNHYFPAEAVNSALLRPSSTTTICPWKGTAHYYSLQVDGADNLDAAWFYPDPKPSANNIRGRIAFWKSVEVG
jgi:uncharacterized protein (DUF427 family)